MTMKPETRDALEKYFLLVNYSEAEKAECLNEIKDKLKALTCPPEITYGTSVIEENLNGYDLSDNVFAQAFYDIESAVEQTAEARAKGHSAVTVAILSAPIGARQVILAYSVLLIEDNIKFRSKLFGDKYFLNPNSLTSVNYH